MSNAAPFVELFRTRQNHYVYDVHTNEILEVAAIVHAIVPDAGTLSDAEILGKHGHVWPPEELAKALGEIRSCREKGYFSSGRPARVQSPFSDADIAYSLEHRMEQLVLDVTEECNLQCNYCIYSGKYSFVPEHRWRQMPLATAKAAIAFYMNHSDDAARHAVSFYGGEPLLRPDFIAQCLSFTRSRWPERPTAFSVTTNGTLLRGKVLDLFMANDVRVSVSLDGPETVHDRHRVDKAGNGTYARILRNLRQIKERDPSYFNRNLSFLAVSAPPYEHNTVSEFFETLDLIDADFPCQQLRYGKVDSYGTTLLDRCAPEELENAEKLKPVWEKYALCLVEGRPFAREAWIGKCLFDHGFELIHKRPMTRLADVHLPGSICLPGARKVLVMADGTLQLCERVSLNFPLGNVFTGFDRQAVRSVVERYVATAPEECCNCWAVRLCDFCYTRIHKGPEFDPARKVAECEKFREMMHGFLVNYCRIREERDDAFSFLG